MTRLPGSFPLFFEEAHGARFVDADGIEYVDFCLGDTGAMAGHALPQVADALAAQARRGITTMLPNDDAPWVAAELARRFGLPTWQIAMTATDANRFVLRFCRHLTGRQKVLVMDWCSRGRARSARLSTPRSPLRWCSSTTSTRWKLRCAIEMSPVC